MHSSSLHRLHLCVACTGCVLEDVADGKEKDVNIKVMSEQLGKFMKGELAPSTLEDFHSKSEL